MAEKKMIYATYMSASGQIRLPSPLLDDLDSKFVLLEEPERLQLYSLTEWHRREQELRRNMRSDPTGSLQPLRDTWQKQLVNINC